MESLRVETKNRVELIDITKKIQEAVNKTGIKDGIVVVYTKHTTTALIINENEEGLKEDILFLLNKLIPASENYKHNKIDNNADSHLRSILLGNSLVIPLVNSKLGLGTWQRVFFVELDGPRSRTIYVKVISG